MKPIVCIVVVIAFAACGKSGKGKELDQRALCEQVIAKSATCCPMTEDEKKIGIEACLDQKMEKSQRETMQCVLGASCEDLLAGKACGGMRCKTAKANAELCEQLIAKSDECCDFTPEDEATGREQCEAAELSDAQRDTVKCVLETSCPELLGGTACGGFKCKNK